MFLFRVCELSTFLRPIRLATCSPQRACTAARVGDRTYSVPMTLADITTWAAMHRNPRIAKTASELGVTMATSFVPALTTRCRRAARARCPSRVGSPATSVVRTPRWTRDSASKSCASAKASSTSLRFPLRRFISEGSAADGTGLCVLLIGRAARDARRPVGRHPRGSVLLERQRGGLGGEGLPAPSVAVGQRDHHQERGSGRDRKSVV